MAITSENLNQMFRQSRSYTRQGLLSRVLALYLQEPSTVLPRVSPLAGRGLKCSLRSPRLERLAR